MLAIFALFISAVAAQGCGSHGCSDGTVCMAYTLGQPNDLKCVPEFNKFTANFFEYDGHTRIYVSDCKVNGDYINLVMDNENIIGDCYYRATNGDVNLDCLKKGVKCLDTKTACNKAGGSWSNGGRWDCRTPTSQKKKKCCEILEPHGWLKAHEGECHLMCLGDGEIICRTVDC